MSITRCPHCDNNYDQDYDVEHEEICKEKNGETHEDKWRADAYMGAQYDTIDVGDDDHEHIVVIPDAPTNPEPYDRWVDDGLTERAEKFNKFKRK